ncbi:MAG: hypothetical protein LBJ38_01245 [Oscillospiraceae bacterium]|nr:hypothetical protein [Oscillospiraceae bacterium]
MVLSEGERVTCYQVGFGGGCFGVEQLCSPLSAEPNKILIVRKGQFSTCDFSAVTRATSAKLITLLSCRENEAKNEFYAARAKPIG